MNTPIEFKRQLSRDHAWHEYLLWTVYNPETDLFEAIVWERWRIRRKACRIAERTDVTMYGSPAIDVEWYEVPLFKPRKKK